MAAGCAETPPGPGTATSCFDDSRAPSRWRHPETTDLDLTPTVVHPGDRFQARPKKPHEPVSFALHRIALDVPDPCSVIFRLDHDESGPTWERSPHSGIYVEVSRLWDSRVIPAITPPVARPGRYKICTDDNQCSTLTVVP
jgi:hypothetical protein